jgi:hypothetical protein
VHLVHSPLFRASCLSGRPVWRVAKVFFGVAATTRPPENVCNHQFCMCHTQIWVAIVFAIVCNFWTLNSDLAMCKAPSASGTDIRPRLSSRGAMPCVFVCHELWTPFLWAHEVQVHSGYQSRQPPLSSGGVEAGVARTHRTKWMPQALIIVIAYQLPPPTCSSHDSEGGWKAGLVTHVV